MRKKLVKTAVIILAIALVICLIPVRLVYRDGGSVEYKAMAYSITYYNKLAHGVLENGELYDENDQENTFRLNGWRIEILGHVFRDDYDSIKANIH